jgi:hypothetical protein
MKRNTDRRSFLKSSLWGGASLAALPAILDRSFAGESNLLNQVPVSSRQPGSVATKGGQKLSKQEILEKARERLYPTCRVCPVCDGVACSGDPYGVAGIGSGMSFQNNFTALQKVRLVMRTLHDVTKADPSTTIFGHKISFPAVAAPMGPFATKLGKGIPVQDWFEAICQGCVNAGTLGAVADAFGGYTTEELESRLELLKRFKGKALYNSKPVSNSVILKWLPLIEAGEAAWLSIDVDSGPKSATELRELVKAFKTPIVVKGIMTLDDAMRCMDAGVAGIAVSNHGGRRLDHTPGTAEVLPTIAAKLKGKIPILTDGCVQSGSDVLKYLGLGADVVMVGRHILRAAYGGGADGVALFMNQMRQEFAGAMVLTGVSSVAKIDSSVVSVVG